MKKIIYLSVLLLISNNVWAQDVIFSQNLENNIIKNPGLIGFFNEDYRIGFQVRNQWSSVGVNYMTTSAYTEIKKVLDENNGDYLSMAFSFINDKAGSINFTRNEVMAGFNYNKSLKDNYHHSYLSLGLLTQFTNGGIDKNSMEFSTQIQNAQFNPALLSHENIQSESNNYFDLGVGVSYLVSPDNYENDNLYIGVGAYHLLEPSIKYISSDLESKIYRKYVVNAGYSKFINKSLNLVSVFNIQKQGPYQEILVGIFTDIKKQEKDQATKIVRFGFLYRFNDSFIPTIKFDYPSISFAVSYDVPSVSRVIPNRFYGALELSVITKGIFKNSLVGSKMCPRF
jgi:type IX secretion system PorP/SprF family membrane protein